MRICRISNAISRLGRCAFLIARVCGCPASCSPPFCVPQSEGCAPLMVNLRTHDRSPSTTLPTHALGRAGRHHCWSLQPQAPSQDARHGERHAAARPLAVAERRQLSQSAATQGLYVEVRFHVKTTSACQPLIATCNLARLTSRSGLQSPHSILVQRLAQAGRK